MGEDDDDAEDVDDDATEATAGKGGPAAAAKANKKGVVPKEAELDEVEVGDEDEDEE